MYIKYLKLLKCFECFVVHSTIAFHKVMKNIIHLKLENVIKNGKLKYL